MKDLLIFPYNGNAIEALDCVGSEYRFIGFIDDTPSKQGVGIGGCKVYSRDALSSFPDAKVLAVPGSTISFKQRSRVIDGLKISEDRLASIIHPSASVSRRSTIGKNVLIMANSVLTSNCIIGDHVCILPGSVIHHDSKIGDYTLIGSGVNIAGNVTVGHNTYIGMGSSIKDGVRIGSKTLIGMGSNVLTDIVSNSKVVGNPARKID